MTKKPIFNYVQSNAFSCGPAALATLASGYMEDILARLSNTSLEQGTDSNGLIKAAKHLGFEVAEHDGISLDSLKTLIDEYGSAMVSINLWGGGHYAVVLDYDEKGIILFDPASQEKVYFYNDEFLRIWHEPLEPITGYHWCFIIFMPTSSRN